MTEFKMDAMQVHNAPVLLQTALTPGFILLGQRLIQTTHGTGAGCDSHERLGHFSHLPRTCSRHEHFCQSFGYLWFVATVAIEDLCVKLAFTISGNLKVLNTPCGSHQISLVIPVTISFAFRATLSPPHSKQGLQFFTHHPFQQCSHSFLCEIAQILPKPL